MAKSVYIDFPYPTIEEVAKLGNVSKKRMRELIAMAEELKRKQREAEEKKKKAAAKKRAAKRAVTKRSAKKIAR